MARVVIVGGGIVGLSVARAALRAGHEAVLLEQGPIPNPRSASFDDHRMIRPHYGAAGGYARMVFDAFASWEGVWTDLGAQHFVDTGAIAIAERPGDYAHATLATFRDLGIAHEVLDRSGIERLCPHLAVPKGATWACSPARAGRSSRGASWKGWPGGSRRTAPICGRTRAWRRWTPPAAR